MERKVIEKNGKKVEYFIENNEVVICDATTGNLIVKVPLSIEEFTAKGMDEFHTCMRGCYPLSHGSPAEFAECIALCSTLIPT